MNTQTISLIISDKLNYWATMLLSRLAMPLHRLTMLLYRLAMPLHRLATLLHRLTMLLYRSALTLQQSKIEFHTELGIDFHPLN